MLSDGELLRQYAEAGSQAAFATLVQRHVNVVYRTVLRRVGDNAHAADDVTQRVFTALARKAGALTSRESLAGWLYSSARFAAAEVVRSEQRRRQHEQQAHVMNELGAVAKIPADKLEPFLDEFMEGLPERDREAVLLHFFEGRTFSEIGQAFSMSPDAARMRVSRAVDRLRSEMERRGVTSTAAAVAAVLATQSGALAGTPSAAALATRAIADAGVGCAATAGAGATALAAAKLPLAFGVGAAAVVIGIGAAAHAYRASSDAVVREEVVIAQPAIEDVRETAAPDSSNVAPPLNVLRAQDAAAPGGAARFDVLTAEEKNLLAMLWRGLDNARPGFAPWSVWDSRRPTTRGLIGFCNAGSWRWGPSRFVAAARCISPPRASRVAPTTARPLKRTFPLGTCRCRSAERAAPRAPGDPSWRSCFQTVLHLARIWPMVHGGSSSHDPAVFCGTE